MHLIWSDLEQHQSVVSEKQWRRMTLYFQEGKSLAQVSVQEGLLRPAGARIAKTSLEQSIGRGCRNLLRVMLRKSFTWNDIAKQARESAANPEQWRRVRAGLLTRDGANEIARKEGRIKGVIELSIGRGCIALLNSLLGRPVRVPTEVVTADLDDKPLDQEEIPSTAPAAEAAPAKAAKKRRVKRARQPEKRYSLRLADDTPGASNHGTSEPGGTIAEAFRAAFAAQAAAAKKNDVGRP